MSDRTYEILFIADPNLGEPEVDALTPWSRATSRRRAAASRRSRSGARSASPTEWASTARAPTSSSSPRAAADLVKEVERRLRVTDGVIRFLTVRVDEELRKAERRKAKRTRGGREAARQDVRSDLAPCTRRCSSELGGLRQRQQSGRPARRRGGVRQPLERAGAGGKDAGKRYFFRRRKVCKFCADKIDYIDYKDVKLLSLVRARARQDPSPAHVRDLRGAPAQADPGHQAGSQHRATALRRGLTGRPGMAGELRSAEVTPERQRGRAARGVRFVAEACGHSATRAVRCGGRGRGARRATALPSPYVGRDWVGGR